MSGQINKKEIEILLKEGKTRQEILEIMSSNNDKELLIKELESNEDPELSKKYKIVKVILLTSLSILALYNALYAFILGIDFGFYYSLFLIAISLILPSLFFYYIKKGKKTGYSSLLIIMLLGIGKSLKGFDGILQEGNFIIMLVSFYIILIVIILITSGYLLNKLFPKIKINLNGELIQ